MLLISYINIHSKYDARMCYKLYYCLKKEFVILKCNYKYGTGIQGTMTYLSLSVWHLANLQCAVNEIKDSCLALETWLIA